MSFTLWVFLILSNTILMCAMVCVFLYVLVKRASARPINRLLVR